MTERDDGRLVNLLGVLALAVTDGIVEVVDAAADLTDAAPAALVALHETGPGRTISDLRQLVGLSHSGAVRLVDRLVGAGYLERVAGRDARTVGLRLTRRGAAAARRIRAARGATVAAALDGLDRAQRAQFEALCEAVVANLAERRLARRTTGQVPAGGAMCRLCDFVACGRPEDRCPAAQAHGLDID